MRWSESEIEKLRDLLADGAITREEFDAAELALRRAASREEASLERPDAPGFDDDTMDKDHSNPDRAGGAGQMPKRGPGIGRAAIAGIVAVIAIAAILLVVLLPKQSDRAAAPDGSAGQSADGRDRYAPVIQAYKDHFVDLKSGQGEKVNRELEHAIPSFGWGLLSYALVDIASDGAPELVIALKFEDAGNGDGTSGSVATYRVYDIYGMKGDGTVARLNLAKRQYDGSYVNAAEGERFGDSPVCYICDGGVIHTTQEGIDPTGAVDECYWRVQENSVDCVMVDWLYGSLESTYRELAPGDVDKVGSQEASAVRAQYKPAESIKWVALKDFGGTV